MLLLLAVEFNTVKVTYILGSSESNGGQKYLSGCWGNPEFNRPTNTSIRTNSGNITVCFNVQLKVWWHSFLCWTLNLYFLSRACKSCLDIRCWMLMSVLRLTLCVQTKRWWVDYFLFMRSVQTSGEFIYLESEILSWTSISLTSFTAETQTNSDRHLSNCLATSQRYPSNHLECQSTRATAQ